MKILKWWEETQIPKAKEALILKEPEPLEEPETPKESEAETPWASVGGKSLGQSEPGPSTSQAAAQLRPALTHCLLGIPGSTRYQQRFPGPPCRGREPRGSALAALSPAHYDAWPPAQRTRAGPSLSICLILQAEAPFQQQGALHHRQ